MPKRSRTAARSARSNAQASLDRLRGEPRRNEALLAFGESMFANANRFVRAGMALEAALDDADALPQRDAVLAFASRVDAHLAAIARSLREDAPPPSERLRTAERALAERLEATKRDDSVDVAVAVADACDRITDSVDTLAYLVRRRGDSAATPALGHLDSRRTMNS